MTSSPTSTATCQQLPCRALDDPTPASLAFLATRTILAPKNEDVHALNDAALERLPAASHVEYLDSLDLPGLPPSTFALMLLRNMDYEAGLCNGTHALIGLSPSVPYH